ncbi:MAG: hypothetical protein ACFFB0_20750 [Promethearchaeota archaeon]
MFIEEKDIRAEENNDNLIFKQLKFFYEQGKRNNNYIKALFLHHLLDFFKETYIDINNIERVFEKFIENKIPFTITDSEGKEVNFKEELNQIFQLIRRNKVELIQDLKS